MRYDLAVIGAGPGGYRAAAYAASQGLTVAVYEQATVGGTCLNRGCIPTKTYVHSHSFEEAVVRQQQVVLQLRSGVEGILSQPGITLVRAHASLGDIDARHVIIATGSRAKMPPIEGLFDDPRVVDATGLLALTRLPRRLCIIGAGVIGMEFASVFRRFGAEVMVIEAMKECLPMLDSDLAKRLRKLMEKQGITFRMKTALTSLCDIDADIILVATGRRAYTEGLGLEHTAIATDPHGFLATHPDTFQCLVGDTVSQQYYAIGDVNGRSLLAHAAEMQAVRAVNHILHKPDGIRFNIMPAAIFTTPEAACVGPNEEQLKTGDTPYECHKAFWRANGKAQAMGESEGLLKLFAAPDDGLLLGCHAYGAHATDLVQEVSALMCRDTTLSQLRDIIHIHPTLSEIVKAATD